MQVGKDAVEGDDVVEGEGGLPVGLRGGAAFDAGGAGAGEGVDVSGELGDGEGEGFGAEGFAEDLGGEAGRDDRSRQPWVRAAEIGERGS